MIIVIKRVLWDLGSVRSSTVSFKALPLSAESLALAAPRRPQIEKSDSAPGRVTEGAKGNTRASGGQGLFFHWEVEKSFRWTVNPFYFL